MVVIGFAGAISASKTAAVIWNGVNNLRTAQDARLDPEKFETTLVETGFNNARTTRTLAKFQNARQV